MGIAAFFKNVVNTCGKFAVDTAVGLPGNILGDTISDIIQNAVNKYTDRHTLNSVTRDYVKSLECVDILGAVAEECVGKKYKHEKDLITEFFKKLLALYSEERNSDSAIMEGFLAKSETYNGLTPDDKALVRDTFYELREHLLDQQFKKLGDDNKVLYHCIESLFDPKAFAKAIAEELAGKKTDAEVAEVVKSKYSFTYIKHECPECKAQGSHYVRYDAKTGRLHCDHCNATFTLEHNQKNYLTKDYFDNALKILEGNLTKIVIEDGDKTRMTVTEQGGAILGAIADLRSDINGNNATLIQKTAVLEEENRKQKKELEEKQKQIEQLKQTASGSSTRNSTFVSNNPPKQNDVGFRTPYNANKYSIDEIDFNLMASIANGNKKTPYSEKENDKAGASGIYKGKYSFPNGNSYDGDMLNGKPYGHGIENNVLGRKKFEGEYKDGERYGHGIEYHYNGEKEFEGEYKDGERHGHGIEYHYNGEKEFEGVYKDGKRHGHGIEYRYDGEKEFEGEYENGKRHGHGIEYSRGNKKFEGEYQEGLRHGYGIEYGGGNKKFEGEYQNGKNARN